MGVQLVDLGYDEGLPALLGDWLIKIDEIVRDVEAERQASTSAASASTGLARALGAS